ncbi:MAG: GspE/PulE family protein [Acidobacteriota bacterium]
MVLSDLVNDAVASLWARYAAGIAAVATVAARWLERPPRRDSKPAPVASLEPPPHAQPRTVATASRLLPEAGSLERHLRRRPDVPAFVDELLAAAIAAGASDVHIQPQDVHTRIAWRVQRELVEVLAAPQAHHELIVRRIKILANLTTYQTDLPQDGRLEVATPRGSVDVRVSVLPTRHGEKVVMRLTRAGSGLIELDQLGMTEALRLDFEDLLAQPQGLIVLSGPTGCGKTTTLYSALAHIHRGRGDTTSIATIEDPIEIDLPFLSQTQVDPAVGLSFGQTLRAVLRQDPNVMMVGEIRDQETAHTAVEAGLSGHLILTTLHADSTAGVFNRLIDMEVEPFLAASSVLASVSQRLARRLCAECRRPVASDSKAKRQMTRAGINATAAENLSFYEAQGCAACEHTGVAGVTAIFELLRVTPRLRELVGDKVVTPEIERAAVEEGMIPLLRAAILEAVAGTISLEEALRVVR